MDLIKRFGFTKSKVKQTNLKLNKSMAPIIANDVITLKDVHYKIVGSLMNVTVCRMVDLEDQITTKWFYVHQSYTYLWHYIF
jgi:hypothetical protein